MCKKPVVLVADDARSIVDILSVVMKARDMEVLAAYNGGDAWDMIQESKPDLAVLDIVMPGINGLELCSKIKTHPDFHDMPVIMITSITKDTDLADGFWRQGTEADAFITKPFDPYELADQVERLLRQPEGEKAPAEASSC